MGEERFDKDDFLFRRLILTFQTAAIQQMGKLADPVTGSPVRDLEQAALSIDTLDMLRKKCDGNLTPEESRLLDHVVSELKLNYVDEIGRPEPQQADEEGDKGPAEQGDREQEPAD